jgi:DNA polymerase-3 subunit delta'
MASDRARKRRAADAGADETFVPFTFSRILEQRRARRILQTALAGDRLNGAYLLYGEPGVGKTLAALAAAATLNCESPVEAEAGRDACGTCLPCRKVARMAHPDVHLAIPVPSSYRKGQPASVDPEKYREVLDTIARTRFYRLAFERNVTLSVDQIRDLIHEGSLTRVEGRRKVMVVSQAHQMNMSAANALLKTLEEPRGDLVIFLTAPDPEALLPTVASRCQPVRFDALSSPLIESVLVERLGSPPEKSRLLATLARGSLGRALEMKDEDIVSFRDRALALCRKPDGHADLLKEVRSLVGWDQSAARRLAEVLVVWLRDLLAARFGLPEESLLNRDRLADIRAEARSLEAEEIRRRLAIFEDLARTIEANVTPELAVFSALMKLDSPARPVRSAS